MNLDIMLKAQRELDERINQKHGLKEQDLFSEKIVALQAELAEMANEARWFKHWSEDQEPRLLKSIPDMDHFEKTREARFIRSNPLLEEYADALHFFLSIANLKGWVDRIWSWKLSYEKFPKERSLTELYSETIRSLFAIKEPWDSAYFEDAWLAFMAMGLHHFGFTEDEIENAYFRKNRINHERQATGY